MDAICTWMILIYFSLYLYYPLSAWYGIGDDRKVREMFVFHQGMFTVSACIYLIFLVAPVEVHLREQITEQELQGTGLLSDSILCFTLEMHHTMLGLVSMWYRVSLFSRFWSDGMFGVIRFRF